MHLLRPMRSTNQKIKNRNNNKEEEGMRFWSVGGREIDSVGFYQSDVNLYLGEGKEKTPARLHGKGSEGCYSWYARNPCGLVGWDCRRVQICLRHPLSYYIVHRQIPVITCFEQEQAPASWCF